MPATQPVKSPGHNISLVEVNTTGQTTRINEALNLIDALLFCLVKDKDLATPPGSPANGDRYIVAASPTGAWVGRTNNIAAYYNSAWVFYLPKKGWQVHVDDESKDYQFNGTSWAEKTSTVTTAPTRTTVSKSSSFTASTSEAAIYEIDCTGGNVIVTLPAASGAANRGWVLRRIDASANTLTVDPNGSETINGQTTWPIVSQYETLDINSNGTSWGII